MAFPIRGGTALITGAASEIGAALTTSLAERGADLALVDRDGPRLEAVATAARRYGLRVSEHVIDVADAASLAALPDAVLAKHGRLTILVNNAGVSLAGSFVDVALPDIEWLFAINFWAAVRLTKASMGALMREKTAHIVNVSSLFGLIAPPGQVAYAASKFGLRGFSEALRHELSGGSVSLTVVHPGGVRTRIAETARVPKNLNSEIARAGIRSFEGLLRTEPAEVAERIAVAIERRQKRLLISYDARAVDRVQRLFPSVYWELVSRKTSAMRPTKIRKEAV